MNIHPVQLYRHTDTQAGLFKVFLINEHFKFSSYSHIKKANHSGIFGSGSLQINSISDLKFVSVKFVIFKGDLELFLYASCCIYYKKDLPSLIQILCRCQRFTSREKVLLGNV